ncbi:DUF6902 family protein [Planktotalea sp.]|uniref:DUF6902 family protein n=1 Tax=Planktotalea sp. TaxID=2029877 RepID=UPI003D6B0531
MSDNVIQLSQRKPIKTNSLGCLTQSFSTSRRHQEDVFWLKENAELLNIFECTNVDRAGLDLQTYATFYSDLPERLRFFPQYYRFMLSLALDLEALGMTGTVAEELCVFAHLSGLAKGELSDLQRGEAMRLLARRGIHLEDGDALTERLHHFINHSATFAIPNRKAAYELTHIVFYLSEYGRKDPEIGKAAIDSLIFAGILAHMEQNADILSEVCVALRFAGQVPPKVWETWLKQVVRGFDRSGDTGGASDHYHEYLVANWACAAMGEASFNGSYSPKGQSFYSPVMPLGAMRSLSEALHDSAAARRSDWAGMKGQLFDRLPLDVAAHIDTVAGATPKFDAFFEHFARAAQISAKALPTKPDFVGGR